MVAEPELPDTITPGDLDADVRRDLRGLQKETAESVARHLVAAGLLVDDDPARALTHARYARVRASRIAVVREAAGIVAYHAGEWNEALGEFRAARRMGGGSGHIPVMADIERALGRPERALDLTRGPDARDLAPAERIELLIVAAGARRDLGELDAAVVGLQVAELDPARRDPWSARLFYAYADNLLAAGRQSDAVQWFVHAYDADDEEQTDAAARIEDLTGDAPPGAAVDDDFVLDVEDVPPGEFEPDDVATDVAAVDAGADEPDGQDADQTPVAEVGTGIDATVPEAAAPGPSIRDTPDPSPPTRDTPDAHPVIEEAGAADPVVPDADDVDQLAVDAAAAEPVLDEPDRRGTAGSTDAPPDEDGRADPAEPR